MIWILLCIPAGDVRLSIVRPTLICWVNYLLQGEKGFWPPPKKIFFVVYTSTTRYTHLVSPFPHLFSDPKKSIKMRTHYCGYAKTRVLDWNWGKFWHNFCRPLVASVICQMFLFRVYKILSQIINIRCLLCRSEGSLCFKWNVLAKNISNFAIFFGIWKINLNFFPFIVPLYKHFSQWN